MSLLEGMVKVGGILHVPAGRYGESGGYHARRCINLQLNKAK